MSFLSLPAATQPALYLGTGPSDRTSVNRFFAPFHCFIDDLECRTLL